MSSDRAPEGATFTEPARVRGKHRFMAGTCVDCGKPLDPVCSANLNIPTVAPEGAKELKPCPFCSNQPPVNRAMDMDHWLIECCYAMVLGENQQDAAKSWNDRISPESAPAPKSGSFVEDNEDGHLEFGDDEGWE